jgi:hypothetical protein
MLGVLGVLQNWSNTSPHAGQNASCKAWAECIEMNSLHPSQYHSVVPHSAK